MSLIPKKKQEYIANGGTVCPYCGDGQLDGGSVEIIAGGAEQAIQCLNCAQRWTDIHRLVDIVTDPDGNEEVSTS